MEDLVVVFDIDDTLYFERDYVESGFHHVAREVTKNSPLDREIVFEYLWNLFEEGVRGDNFDRLLDARPALRDRWAVEDLVEIYREHEPNIDWNQEMKEAVDELRSRFHLAALSDGPLPSQRAKVRALNLEECFDPIILTREVAPDAEKPDLRPFRRVEQATAESGSRLVYVADNPKKDFIAPNELGWITIRYRDSRQLRHAAEPPTQEAAPERVVEGPGKLSEAISEQAAATDDPKNPEA